MSQAKQAFILLGTVGSAIILTSALLMFLNLKIHSTGAKSPSAEHTYWYGKVTELRNCNSTGKYGYKCDVSIDTMKTPYRMDVTDFPGEGVDVGDTIGFIHREWPNGISTHLVRNGREVKQSWCQKWMPCYSIYMSHHAE